MVQSQDIGMKCIYSGFELGDLGRFKPFNFSHKNAYFSY